MRARVVSFDEQRGDGWLVSDDGDELYFHCVEIADGSRSISVDTVVSARRQVGHLGRDEAAEIYSLAD